MGKPPFPLATACIRQDDLESSWVSSRVPWQRKGGCEPPKFHRWLTAGRGDVRRLPYYLLVAVPESGVCE